MPEDFYVAGGNPDNLRDWAWDGTTWRSEADFLESTIFRYGKSIKKNGEILEAGSKRIRVACLLAAASPIAGVTAFFLSWWAQVLN